MCLASGRRQTFTIQPTSPLNPFTTAVRVSLPLPGLALPARGLSVSNTLTGGTIVRRIAPGDPTTKDYRIERVTVMVADGRVVSASCG